MSPVKMTAQQSTALTSTSSSKKSDEAPSALSISLSINMETNM
jgi:hypothetical protein